MSEREAKQSCRGTHGVTDSMNMCATTTRLEDESSLHTTGGGDVVMTLMDKSDVLGSRLAHDCTHEHAAHKERSSHCTLDTSCTPDQGIQRTFPMRMHDWTSVAEMMSDTFAAHRQGLAARWPPRHGQSPTLLRPHAPPAVMTAMRYSLPSTLSHVYRIPTLASHTESEGEGGLADMHKSNTHDSAQRGSAAIVSTSTRVGKADAHADVSEMHENGRRLRQLLSLLSDTNQTDVTSTALLSVQQLIDQSTHPSLNEEILDGDCRLECERCGCRTRTRLRTVVLSQRRVGLATGVRHGASIVSHIRTAEESVHAWIDRRTEGARSASSPEASVTDAVSPTIQEEDEQEEEDEEDDSLDDGVPFYLTIQLHRFTYHRETMSYEKVMQAVLLESNITLPVVVLGSSGAPSARAEGADGRQGSALTRTASRHASITSSPVAACDTSLKDSTQPNAQEEGCDGGGVCDERDMRHGGCPRETVCHMRDVRNTHTRVCEDNFACRNDSSSSAAAADATPSCPPHTAIHAPETDDDVCNMDRMPLRRVPFRLCSIIVHSGRTPHSGHYFTLTRCEEEAGGGSRRAAAVAAHAPSGCPCSHRRGARRQSFASDAARAVRASTCAHHTLPYSQCIGAGATRCGDVCGSSESSEHTSDCDCPSIDSGSHNVCRNSADDDDDDNALAAEDDSEGASRMSSDESVLNENKPRRRRPAAAAAGGAGASLPPMQSDCLHRCARQRVDGGWHSGDASMRCGGADARSRDDHTYGAHTRAGHALNTLSKGADAANEAARTAALDGATGWTVINDAVVESVSPAVMALVLSGQGGVYSSDETPYVLMYERVVGCSKSRHRNASRNGGQNITDGADEKEEREVNTDDSYGSDDDRADTSIEGVPASRCHTEDGSCKTTAATPKTRHYCALPLHHLPRALTRSFEQTMQSADQTRQTNVQRGW